MMDWALSSGCPEDNLASSAAFNGYFRTLKYLHEKGVPFAENTTNMAAWNGHSEILKWLRECGYPWDTWTCINAAIEGYYDIFVWACENGCPNDPLGILGSIATTTNAQRVSGQTCVEDGFPNASPSQWRKIRGAIEIAVYVITQGGKRDVEAEVRADLEAGADPVALYEALHISK